MKYFAHQQLKGVGDHSQEFLEFTGYAFHVRRRLTSEEQATIGPAVDLRGTPEAKQRFLAVQSILPPQAIRLAYDEIGDAVP